MSESGKCLCGAVTFEAEDIDTHVHACHCNMCRGWTGGPMQAAQVGKIKFTGEENITRYASSEWAERGFCSRCGSNLFYYLIPQSMYLMATGTFDNADQFELAGEIFIDEKPTGYEFAGDHPRLTGAEFMASMGAADQ